MQMSLGILLYSKYSPRSSQLIEHINNCGVNISEIYNIHPLCIDNKKTRNQIKAEKQLNITMVPCLLMVQPTGVMEKFDGKSIFNWFEEKIEAHGPKTPIEEPQRPITPPPPRPRPKDNYVPQTLRGRGVPIKEMETSSIDDLSEEEGEETDQDEDEPGIVQREGPSGFKKGKFKGKKPSKGQVPGGSVKSGNSGKVDIAKVMAQAQAHQRKAEKKMV